MKIFLATPKSMEADDAETLRDEIGAFVNKVYPDAKIVLASEEFKRMAGAFDGWAGWASYVATGVDYSTRKLNYSVVVLPGAQLGKATAAIVELRLATRHPVVLWTGSGFLKVGSVHATDPDNYVNGWEVVAEGQLH